MGHVCVLAAGVLSTGAISIGALSCAPRTGFAGMPRWMLIFVLGLGCMGAGFLAPGINGAILLGGGFLMMLLFYLIVERAEKRHRPTPGE